MHVACRILSETPSECPTPREPPRALGPAATPQQAREFKQLELSEMQRLLALEPIEDCPWLFFCNLPELTAAFASPATQEVQVCAEVTFKQLVTHCNKKELWTAKVYTNTCTNTLNVALAGPHRSVDQNRLVVVKLEPGKSIVALATRYQNTAYFPRVRLKALEVTSNWTQMVSLYATSQYSPRLQPAAASQHWPSSQPAASDNLHATPLTRKELKPRRLMARWNELPAHEQQLLRDALPIEEAEITIHMSLAKRRRLATAFTNREKCMSVSLEAAGSAPSPPYPKASVARSAPTSALPVTGKPHSQTDEGCRNRLSFKEAVWIAYRGHATKEGPCECCGVMLQRHDTGMWHAGHIVPHCYNGPKSVENSRPVCGQCNVRMGTMNLFDYKAQYYPHR